MSRFKVGDRVLVLPDYSRMYRADGGVVVGVKPDRLGRFGLDEYLIEFPPNLRRSVLDLRLIPETAGPATSARSKIP